MTSKTVPPEHLQGTAWMGAVYNIPLADGYACWLGGIQIKNVSVAQIVVMQDKEQHKRESGE